MNIVLIRHGETEENARMTIQGHKGGTLSLNGINQAEFLGGILNARFQAPVIYCSDLNRARHTAELISNKTGSPVNPDARLREREYGALEGKSFFQLKRQMVTQKKDIYELEIDGAESYNDFSLRVEDFLGSLFRSTLQTALVITHQGVVDYVLKTRYPGSKFKVPNCSAFLLAGADKHTLEFIEVIK